MYKNSMKKLDKGHAREWTRAPYRYAVLNNATFADWMGEERYGYGGKEHDRTLGIELQV